MTVKLHWTCINPNHSPDEGGYYRSSEGRFEISPRFRHTVYPDGYDLSDSLKKGERIPSFDRIGEAKAYAVARVTKEMDELIARLN